MDDDLDETEVDADFDPEVDVELDEELVDDIVELEDPDLDDAEVPDLELVDDDVVVDAPVVPTRRAKVGVSAEEDEEEDDEADPDDVEEDLDTILKDRIASGDDADEEDEEEVLEKVDPESSDGVTARKEGEFTCTRCFMIVHPRQFGRRDRLTCPVGDDDCPSLAIVAKLK